MANGELAERNDLMPYPVNTTLRYNEEDIAFAKREDSYNCVLVRAVQRQFPTAIRVRANRKTIGWSLPDEDIRIIYPMPDKGREKIIKPFDRGEKIEPGVLQLRGGQFRGIDHSYSPEIRTRDRQRSVKATDEDKRTRTHWSHANFERYVVNDESA